jgi:hypothetical protein
MSLALSPVLGTIQIEPLVGEADCARRAADDSTLGLLFAEFAHRERLADAEGPLRLIAAARLTCCGNSSVAQTVVRADLARLLEDLDAEYEQLERHAC